MAIRKNIRSLTTTEKADFINACLALKDNNKAGNKWNEFVLIHSQTSTIFTPSNSSRTQPHGGPAFLAWHRYHLHLLELALQEVSGNSNIGVPYWDWTQDTTNPFNSPLWSDDLMGGNGDTSDGSYVVKTGPFGFSQWTIINEAGNPVTYPDNRFTGGLKRRFGNDISSLPTINEVNNAVWIRNYDSSPYSNTSTNSARNAIEGFINTQLHNRVHRWVGQTMRTSGAPNDPLFYLHHSMIDRMWCRWQSGNGLTAYAPNSGGPFRHNLNDPMLPWDITPNQMLNYNNLGYSYDSLR